MAQWNHAPNRWRDILDWVAEVNHDGLQVAAYASAHTERLKYLVAHRPGVVFPTVAARTFATLDQFNEGRTALHTITGGFEVEQRRDGDYLNKEEPELPPRVEGGGRRGPRRGPRGPRLG